MILYRRTDFDGDESQGGLDLEEKEEHGMNYDRYEPKCNNGHTLMTYRGFPYQQGTVNCDTCKE